MRRFLAIGHTGLVAILHYRMRSLATIGCLVAILLPYLAGIGISTGIQEQAELAIRFGADLYVTMEQFGKPGPVPATLARTIGKIDGVTKAFPRIVSRLTLGKDHEEAVLVGIPLEHFRATVKCVKGRLPKANTLNELVIGTELARRLHLRVGSLIPPFYHSAQGDKISEVVGIFESDVALWQANLVLTSLATASAICNQDGLATEILVYCPSAYRESVRAAILHLQRLPAPGAENRQTLQVISKEDLHTLLPQGLQHREGIFNLHFLLAFAMSMLAILVTAGVGSTERRREIGILKAFGWQTDEVIFRHLVESCLLGLAGAALSILLGFLWLRVFNGYWIASIFLPGVDVQPGFRIPYRLAPIPALLALLLAQILVMTGTLYATWRAAIVPPREAMR